MDRIIGSAMGRIEPALRSGDDWEMTIPGASDSLTLTNGLMSSSLFDGIMI